MDAVNFKRMCRVCLRESDFVTPMFGTVFKSDIPDKLAYCTGLKVTSGDGKPTLICQCCIDNLHISYTLKKTCLRSDRRFFRYFYGIKHDVRVNVERINGDVKPKMIEEEAHVKKEVDGSDYDIDVKDYDNDDDDSINYNDNLNVNNEYESKDDINGTGTVLEGERDDEDDDDFYWQDNDQWSDLATKKIEKHTEKKVKSPTKIIKQKLDEYGNLVMMDKQVHDKKIAPKRCISQDPKKVARRLRRKKPKCRYCECCDRVFASQAERDQHAHDVHGGISTDVMCEICGKVCNKYYLAQHLQSHFAPQFSCAEPGCAYKAYSKGDLDKHKLIHAGEDRRKWPCQQCQKVYMSSSSLSIHVQSVHKRIIKLKFACSYCGKRFISKGKAQIHERIHTDEKPYACKYCQSKFARLDQWRKHTEKTHGVVTPPAKKGRKRYRIVELDQFKDAGKLIGLSKTNESVVKSDGNKTNGNVSKINDSAKKRNNRINKSCSNIEPSGKMNKTYENLGKSDKLMNKSNEMGDKTNGLLEKSSGFTINNIVQGMEVGVTIDGADLDYADTVEVQFIEN